MLMQNNNSIGDNSILSGGNTEVNITNIILKNAVTLLENIPEIDLNYIERKIEEENLEKKLKQFNSVQVYGISGIGKTEVVRTVVNKIKQDYNRSYWISCNNNADEMDLENIVTVLGTKINLIENLKREKIIIVIDNYNMPIESIISKFETFNLKNSKLIFTAQEKTSYAKIEKIFIEYMIFEEAYKIFTITKNSEFESEEFRNFLNGIDKHPMMLQVLKNYILDEENGISFLDFKNSLQLVQLEDNEISQSKKICEKIIGEYYIKSKSIYSFLGLVNSNIIEENFLKDIIISDIPSLIKRSFLKHNKNYYYMHSIILDSINAVVNNDKTKENKIPYENEIIGYLQTQIDIRNIKYYRFIAYNNNFLKDLYRHTDNQYLKILLYNSFITFSNHQNIQIHIENIELLLNGSGLKKYYEIKLLIESVELNIKTMNKEGKEKREEFIKSAIERLEQLKENVNDIECMQLLNHHIAKLYNWIGKYDEAMNIIKKVIQNNPKEYTSILQLCRAYRQKMIEKKGDKEQEKEYLEYVFSTLSELDYKNMPVSIYLELVSLIINRPLNENKILKICLWDNFEYFAETALLFSKNNIFEHIYLTIGHLAGTLSYNQKEFYKEWFKEIEHPNFNECSKELLMAIINIYCSEVKRRKYSNEEYNDLVEAISDFWKVNKEKYMSNLRSNQKDFIFKPIIEFYITIEKYEVAQSELNEIYNNLNEWHLKLQSSILKGFDKFDEAKKKIEEAIRIYTSKGENRYESSFYNDYAEILHEMKDEACFQQLEYSIKICDNNSTKKSWENKLQKWKKDWGKD